MKLNRLLIAGLAWLSATFAHAQHPGATQGYVDSASIPYQTWSNGWSGGSCNTFYASLEYLLWWMKPVCLKVPTLTSGSPADAVPGALDQPNTRLLVGDSRFEFAGASGVRPRIGMTIAPNLAVEAEGFALETVRSRFGFQSTAGSPNTFLPFIAPDSTQQALPFTIPGVVNGSMIATGSSRLWGAEANVVVPCVLSNDCLRLGLLAGVRYLDLRDEIQIQTGQSLAADPTVEAAGYDRLQTINQFYGVQIGERLDWLFERGSFGVYGKFAVGETNLQNDFSGTPLIGTPVAPGLIPGPIQVLPSNSGYNSTYRVTIVTDIGANFRFNVNDNLTLTLGYSLLYWNRILCPGDLMDPRVNPTQLPGRGPVTGAALPAVQALHTDYFAQGINAGFEFRF